MRKFVSASTRVYLTASLALLPFFFLAAPTAYAQNMRFSEAAKPEKSLNPNEAYGNVRFKLEVLERKSGRHSSRSFFDVLLQGIEGLLKKEGEYILTVEALGKSDEVLAKKGIVQLKKTSSGWWIFNRVVKDTETTEWYGDLFSSALVRPDTNNVRIKVRSYYSESSKIDLQTFNLFLDFLAKTKALGVVGSSLETTWKQLAAPIESILSSYVQSDISDIASVSFGKFGGTPYPKEISFFRDVDIARANSVPLKLQARIRVETETREVRVVGPLVNGKVSPLTTYADVLAAAIIGDQPIDAVLSTSKKEVVRKFFADLNSSTGYKGEDVGERCDALLGDLANYFTVRDKVITYWGLLNLYRRKLAANKNASDCLSSGVRGQIVNLGLSLADLPFAGPNFSAKIVPGGSPDDRIVAREDLIKQVLGKKNAVSTFQVFPITE